MEEVMDSREFESRAPGRQDAQDRGASAKNEEPRVAGTHARLEGNIDSPIDQEQGTGNRPQAQSHPVRYLVSRYSVSAAIAGIIAAELGMGGA
jgi:hypothetical protein